MKNQLILLLSTGVYQCYSQNNLTTPPHPNFSSFQGEAYKMPIVEKKNGDKVFRGLQEHYGDNVYDYEVIGKIDLPELKIPETEIDKAKFPGVDRNTQYAMVLESSVEIKVRACYEFSLNSDDGSILWIDDKKIVDNDGGHGMTLKRDSVVFDPGTYPVKVWYFQSLADRFGCMLDARIIGKPDVCPNQEAAPKETLSFNSSVLFNVASSELRMDADSVLAQIKMKLLDTEITKITIIGHTDSSGDEAQNQLLSLARANSMKKAIRRMIGDDHEIQTRGEGERNPIADNDSKEGRQANRRVEIIIE